ncbi:MAG: AAA family ATPase [Flavobacteriaceae bacterium]|nr:AAA family ATPase [Flavobacteriaceae bacterium]
MSTPKATKASPASPAAADKKRDKDKAMQYLSYLCSVFTFCQVLSYVVKMVLFENITIDNFKSIKHIELNDCRRINLFIGRPNVGKSNMLEALSLFSLPYLKYSRKKTLRSFIRIENDAELFYDGNTEEPASVEVEARGKVINKVSANLKYQELRVTEKPETGPKIPVKSYFFPSKFEKGKLSVDFLLPPHGDNLMDIVNRLSQLPKELKDIFNDYGLKYVFDTTNQEIKVIKETSPEKISLIPFGSISDTLKRLIFYKAAIESNTGSVLIFEEPEAHSYPPYISKITQTILASASNQFFITTHSPYVVNDFLESGRDELAIYLVDFRKGQTFVKRLNDTELQEVYEYGVDLFFNTETFLP